MNKSRFQVRRAGAYIIRAAEARPAKVTPRHDPNRVVLPTERDKEMACAFLAYKRGMS